MPCTIVRTPLSFAPPNSPPFSIHTPMLHADDPAAQPPRGSYHIRRPSSSHSATSSDICRYTPRRGALSGFDPPSTADSDPSSSFGSPHSLMSGTIGGSVPMLTLPGYEDRTQCHEAGVNLERSASTSSSAVALRPSSAGLSTAPASQHQRSVHAGKEDMGTQSVGLFSTCTPYHGGNR